MNNRKSGSIAAVLLIAWIGFILLMSSQTAENSGHMSRAVTKNIIQTFEKLGFIKEGASHSVSIIDRFDGMVRAVAHMAMYFFLAVIFSLMLRFLGIRGMKWIVTVFLICLSISILDEINQMHYTGRNNAGMVSAGIEDVLRDIFGVCIALGLIIVNIRVHKITVKN